MAEEHLIGVISDTHIPHRMKEMPPFVYEQLCGCEAIMHAGDLEDIRILEVLNKIAPVYAVRGNIHWQASMGEHDQDLPLAVTVPMGGHVIYMTHGHMNFALTMRDKVVHFATRPTLGEVNQIIIDRLAHIKPPEADIVIFGHTHKPCAEWADGTLYFNPGAVCQTARRFQVSPSMGKIHIYADGRVEAEILPLP
jgi:putative phosphoesterase